MLVYLIFLGGLAVVTGGAELFVRNSSVLARRLGISPLVIGLTLVAMGTSAPELAVSLKGVYSGATDIAVGNIVGSNIFNVLFILGVSALIIPLSVHLQILRLDVPVMILASMLLWVLAWDGKLVFAEGLLFVLIFVSYTVFIIYQSKKEKKEDAADYDKEFSKVSSSALKDWVLCPLMIILGLVLLVLGARWMVSAAIELARGWGVSESVIGLTIVAAGTSLPEVATSIVAAIKGERDIAVGNIVGSNIFNILGILGICSLAAPAQGLVISQGMLNFDIPVMVAVAFACLPIFLTSTRIDRWEGGLFLFYYVAYTSYLVMQSMQHEQLPLLSSALLYFAVPITVVTLFVAFFRDSKSKVKAV